MNDLIEALTIIQKYIGNVYAPTNCSHDEFFIMGPDKDGSSVSPEDMQRLKELGFRWDTEYGHGWKSYRYGSN